MTSATRLRRQASAAAILLSWLLLVCTPLAGAGSTDLGALEVPEKLNLLVVAPHPDDETLGASGLLQRAKRLGGRVTVAYLTSGDGYLDGVELETGKLKPRAEDFVDYGEMRLREALRALEAMDVRPKRLLIFGFPDGGLVDLLTTHWSAKAPFVSPYTRDSRSPYPDSVDGQASYSGVALERALARVITDLGPQWVAVTGAWDVHPDHCAAFHFVLRALRRLAASNKGFASVKLLAYTVHRPDWPGLNDGKRLSPPPGITPAGASWRSLDLTGAELDGKGRALDEYASQMDIMAILFRAFVRSNEIFAVYPSVPAEPSDACGHPLPGPTEAAKR